MPQPFKPLERQEINISERIVETRPRCAVLIASVACEWVRIEHKMTRMFASATGEPRRVSALGFANKPNRVAYAALHAIESLAARISVVTAAWQAIKLSDELRADFEKIAINLRARAGDRNKVVHGLWCAVDSYPEDVLLRTEPSTNQYVRYTPADFETIITRMIQLQQDIDDFNFRCIEARAK